MQEKIDKSRSDFGSNFAQYVLILERTTVIIFLQHNIGDSSLVDEVPESSMYLNLFK